MRNETPHVRYEETRAKSCLYLSRALYVCTNKFTVLVYTQPQLFDGNDDGKELWMISAFRKSALTICAQTLTHKKKFDHVSIFGSRHFVRKTYVVATRTWWNRLFWCVVRKLVHHQCLHSSTHLYSAKTQFYRTVFYSNFLQSVHKSPWRAAVLTEIRGINCVKK